LPAKESTSLPSEDFYDLEGEKGKLIFNKILAILVD